MTISTGGNASRSTVRVISRSRRLRRLRSTDDLRCLGTMIPTRRCARREREALTRTSRCSVRRRFPVRATSRSSVPRVIRRLRGKWADVCGWSCDFLLRPALTRPRTSSAAVLSAASALSCGGARVLRDPIYPTCEDENRASECGACCAGGRLAYPYVVPQMSLKIFRYRPVKLSCSLRWVK